MSWPVSARAAWLGRQGRQRCFHDGAGDGPSGFRALWTGRLTIHTQPGTVAWLRQVLETLDGARIDVEHLSIHTPDLDDVFFAVTGHATTEPTTRQQEEALQR